LSRLAKRFGASVSEATVRLRPAMPLLYTDCAPNMQVVRGVSSGGVWSTTSSGTFGEIYVIT
jgi:hypothetical protein